MKNFLNYYDLLGINTNATKDEILNAYKKKAKEYHPDKNDGHDTAKTLFQYISEAKNVLLDDVKRLEYDYISGVKKRPESKQNIKSVQVKNNDPDWGTIIGAGLVGLLVGVLIDD